MARLKEVMEDFKEILPLIEELANLALKPRHWQDIFQFIDAEMPESETGTGFGPFSVRFLLQYGVLDKLDKIQALSGSASKEYSLEKALAKMKGDWEGLAFRVVEYKDTGTYVIGGTDEVQVRRRFQSRGRVMGISSDAAVAFLRIMVSVALGPCAKAECIVNQRQHQFTAVHALQVTDGPPLWLLLYRPCWMTRLSRRSPCVPHPSSSPWRQRPLLGRSCCCAPRWGTIDIPTAAEQLCCRCTQFTVPAINQQTVCMPRKQRLDHTQACMLQ